MMENKQLEQIISEALDRHKFGSLATVEQNKPKARYMAVFHDGLKVHLATNRKTHKVEELKQNPNAFLLLGFDGTGPKELIEIEGTVHITKNDELRKSLWNDEMKQWFDGPDDPNYVILDIQPSRIEYTGKDQERHIWEG